MNIQTGYKLFEMDSNGRLLPLFINKNEETPMNEWVMAEIVEHHPGFAHRPGWHIGTGVPSAPWLMGADGTYKSQRGKRFKRVWCEVEYVADVDYTPVVESLPKKCFTDRLPDGGFIILESLATVCGLLQIELRLRGFSVRRREFRL